MLDLRKLLNQNKSTIYYRMLQMFQERIYEEPVRFCGDDGRSPSSGRSRDDIPKQIQEYRKQRLQQLVECECGETFLMKDAPHHIESNCHITFKEEKRRRKELEEHIRIENDTDCDSDSDNCSVGGSTRVPVD